MVATRALVTTRETICTCDDAHAFVSHRLRSATALPSNLPNLPEHIENDPPSAPANEMQVIDPAAGIDPRARGVLENVENADLGPLVGGRVGMRRHPQCSAWRRCHAIRCLSVARGGIGCAACQRFEAAGKRLVEAPA